MSGLDPALRDRILHGRAQNGHLDRLCAVLEGYGPTMTAFSGGIDSTLVAVVSAAVHGEEALAVTGISPSLAARERKGAATLAMSISMPHQEVDTNELADPSYRANAGDRCYYCKQELFFVLSSLARRRGFQAVASGDNCDDLGQHRPGMKAGDERGVKKPLIEAEMGKAEIRAVAELIGLPNAQKVASPCLASRIPAGRSVDAQSLAQVEAGEAVLHELGYQVFRVRHHGSMARLEVARAELPRAEQEFETIKTRLCEVGYESVELDPRGYRRPLVILNRSGAAS